MASENLLTQAANAQAAGTSTAVIQTLALSCHARMLEIADNDKPLAVRHALAGAELLSSLAAVGGVLPDWLAIHEEQCCRYGCIWIHELLLAGDGEAAIWVSDALRLLSRMEQLHTDPVDWAPAVRAFLLNHAPITTTILREPSDSSVTRSGANSNELQAGLYGDARIVVVGNCQAHPLMLGLSQALPQASIHFCPSVHLATENDVARLHQRLANADLLVMHRVLPGYRDYIGLDANTLRGLLSPSARSVVLPNLHYEGHHPWSGYAHDPEGRLVSLAEESPLGPYHDFLVMVAAQAGIEPQALLQASCSAFVQQRLHALHESSLAELKKREADCNVAISDWIAANHRKIPVVHTINHPTQIALDQLLRRLLILLDSPHRLGPQVFDQTEHLGALTIPIHPWIRQALQLEPWADTWGQVQGKPFPIGDQIKASHAFYQCHPWIAACNNKHPKFLLASELLAELVVKSSPAAPASPKFQGAVQPLLTPISPPTLYQCIWISDSPLVALTDLGHWLLRQPAEQQNQLPTLVEAACRTRDPELIQGSLDRLMSHPPVEPWRTRLFLELQLASGVDRIVIRSLARGFLAQHQDDAQVWDEACWRTIASLLYADPTVQTQLVSLLRQVAPVECSAFLAPPLDPLTPLTIFEARPAIAAEDAERATPLYATASASIRNPFAPWADPEAADPASLERLVERIREARENRRGFSMLRLGDGEGLFLCGKRPDLGGAIINGAQIEARLAAQGHRLIDPEHRDLRHQFAEAVANADWVGIPDLPQCLNGPVDLVSVASGLMLLLSEEQQLALMPRLAVGGCHVHNFLLQAGCYGRDPFDRVNTVIAPSLPANLRGDPDLLWLHIPGEAVFRADAFGVESHYPHAYQKILRAIEERIQPGDLVLVGAGILGKIYCEAIRRREAIAVDVGSVIDLCSGHGGTRGEYRMNPWLAHHAEGAFSPASRPPMQASDRR
jgi:hypothetical protein